MIRALLIQKGMQWQISKTFWSENTIRSIRFNNKTYHPGEMNEELAKAMSFVIMYVLLLIGSSIFTSFFIGEGYNFSDVFFEAASAQGTVGLSTGITDPGMSPVVESIYIFLMWAGRLEIIPVFVLLKAIFIRNGRN
jgi:trk system potassium uptake protein TrkH